MIVLGIDPGTATTGYGVIQEDEEGRLHVLDYGALLTPKGLPMPERLLELYQQMNQLILLHHPDTGAVEKLFFYRNVTTALAVGQARGVALLCMAQVGMEIAEYTPMEVKQAVAGYGGADKSQVSLMVKALLELPEIPHPDDAADALAIAICHIHSARIRSMSDH